MTEIMKGVPVAKHLIERASALSAELRAVGCIPTLAIVRVGDKDDDISYENGVLRRCESANIEVKRVAVPKEIAQDELIASIEKLNRDDSVNGILLLRPLPKHLDPEKIRHAIAPKKDVDGCTDGSLAGVFAGTDIGFPACTAQAAMEMLDFYGVECKGKRAAVIGRSLVAGRPAAMMLMKRDATVTICHSATENMAEITRQADILFVAAGKAHCISKEYLREGQTVIDVGINWDAAEQKLCGDVCFDEADGLVDRISPVPGGIGAVTSSLLMLHVAQAAQKQTKKK